MSYPSASMHAPIGIDRVGVDHRLHHVLGELHEVGPAALARLEVLVDASARSRPGSGATTRTLAWDALYASVSGDERVFEPAVHPVPEGDLDRRRSQRRGHRPGTAAAMRAGWSSSSARR